MTLTKPAFLLFFTFILGSAGLVMAQSDVPVIENPDTTTLTYCSDSVLVAPNISIQNIQVNEAGEGMKISITGYEQGQDILVYDPVDNLKYLWNNSKGTLEISGIATDKEYQEAVSKVYYKNISSSRITGVRSFSIGLSDADYLPKTGHFYRFINLLDITWKEAKAAADAMKYYGLQGYLVTITSSAENDFVWAKINGVGWIGASDEAQEGRWEWVTGPEKGTHFWQGNYPNGSAVVGRYSSWNAGEPNNVNGGEDFAHVNANPLTTPKSWNDLPNAASLDDEYYRAKGYIVEFGGMENVDLKLSATVKIEVMDATHPELDYSKTQTLFCGVKTAQVNFVFKEEVPLLELIPLDEKVIVSDGQSNRPTVTIPEFGYYKFRLITINKAGCDYSDTIQIEFHNQPEAKFNLDENDCYGYNLQLAFEGTTVEEANFTWFFNQKEYISGNGLDSVQIPLGFEDIERTVGLRVNEQGCVDTLTKPVKVKPDIILSAENTEGCSPVIVNFSATTNKPARAFDWDFGDNNSSDEQNPSHTYINSTDSLLVFDVQLTAYSTDGCNNTAVFQKLVNSSPVPTADFELKPQQALITNPEISFTNTSHAASSYYWDFGDSSSVSDEMNTTHRYDAMGLYKVVLEVQNNYNCFDTIQKQVTVSFDKLFPPNAFSPNANLEEDRVFRIYSEGVIDEGYLLLIFNRWGEVFFESTSQQMGWDGKMKNGDFAPAGVYTWVLQYTDFTDKKHKQQGVVSLVF